MAYIEQQEIALLGDEAAALGAIHAGISAAYGYPGTPSTEILEYLIEEAPKQGITAQWCTNEKTALEAALGVSFAGRRALVTMKHVGLNVASDPFMNSALLGIKGGIVIAVADDPGMHSSQNEQDSRFYAHFAIVPCLEPRSQQEAYNLIGEAFEISEYFHIPILFRMVTRLAHARARVLTASARPQNPISKAGDKTQWMLLPAYARRNYLSLIEKQTSISEWSCAHPVNALELEGRDRDLAVITAGLGGNYYEENAADFIKARQGKNPARLHIGAYPLPVESIQKVCEKASRVIIIEEGQPFIEERLRGLLPPDFTIAGKLNGVFPRSGELDPDNVRRGLGLPPRPNIVTGIASAAGSTFGTSIDIPLLPGRPPQLCQGCPHGDSYDAIKQAVKELDSEENHPTVAITSDIGCYALGAAPPYSVPETIVCMGASIGMAKGAVDGGLKYAIGVIGDSTFLHSGITALIDAAASDAAITVVILDNSIVAMTGCQKTMLPSDRFRDIILGCGVKPEHLVELEPRKPLLAKNTAKLKAEIEYQGLSVVIFRRECLEAARKHKKKI